MFRSKSLLCCKKAALISSTIGSKSSNTSWAKKFNQENKYLFGDLLETQANRKKRITEEKVNTELNIKSHLSQDIPVNFPCSLDGNCSVHAACDNTDIDSRCGKVMTNCCVHSKQSFSDHAVRKKSSSFLLSVPKECVAVNNFEVRFFNKRKTLGFCNEFQHQSLNSYKNRLIDPNFQLSLSVNNDGPSVINCDRFSFSAGKSKGKILNFSDVSQEQKVDCCNTRSCESFFHERATLRSVSRGLYELSARCKGSFMKKFKVLRCAPFLSFHTNSSDSKQSYTDCCGTDGVEDKTENKSLNSTNSSASNKNNSSLVYLNSEITVQRNDKMEVESSGGIHINDLSACSEHENHNKHQENKDCKTPSLSQDVSVLKGDSNSAKNDVFQSYQNSNLMKNNTSMNVIKNDCIIDEVTDTPNEQLIISNEMNGDLTDKNNHFTVMNEQLVPFDNDFKRDTLITEQDVATFHKKIMNNSSNNGNMALDSSCHFIKNKSNIETNSILFSDCFINNDLNNKFKVKVINEQSSDGSHTNRTTNCNKKKFFVLMPISKSKRNDKLNVDGLFTVIKRSQKKEVKTVSSTNINKSAGSCKKFKLQNINIKNCLSLDVLTELSCLDKENIKIKKKLKAVSDIVLDEKPLMCPIIKAVPDDSIGITNQSYKSYKDACRISSSEPTLSQVNALNSGIFLRSSISTKHKDDKAVSDNFFKKLIRKMTFDLSSVTKSHCVNNNPFSEKVFTYKDVYKEKSKLKNFAYSTVTKEKKYDWMRDRDKYSIGFCYKQPKNYPFNSCMSFLRNLHKTGDMKVKKNLKIKDSELSKYAYMSKNNKNSVSRSAIYQNSYKSKNAVINYNKPINMYWNLNSGKRSTSMGNFFKRRENYLNNLPVSKRVYRRNDSMLYKIYNENRKLGLSNKSRNVVSDNKFISNKKAIPSRRDTAYVTDDFGKKYIKRPTSTICKLPKKTRFTYSNVKDSMERNRFGMRSASKEDHYYFSRKSKWGYKNAKESNKTPLRNSNFLYGVSGYRNNSKKTGNLYDNIKLYNENNRDGMNFDEVFVDNEYSSPNFGHYPESYFGTNKITRSRSYVLPKRDLYLDDERQLKIGDKNIFIPNIFYRDHFNSVRDRPAARKGKHSSVFLEKLKQYADAEFKWKNFDYVSHINERNYAIKNYPEFKREKYISEIFKEKSNKSHNFDKKSKLKSLGIGRGHLPKPYQTDVSKFAVSKISSELSRCNYFYPYDPTSPINSEINKSDLIKQYDILLKTEKNNYMQNLRHNKSTGFDNKPESRKTSDTVRNFHGLSSYVKEKINKEPRFKGRPKSFSNTQFSNFTQSHSGNHSRLNNNLAVFLRRAVSPPAVGVKNNKLYKFYKDELKNINEIEKVDKKLLVTNKKVTNVTPVPTRIPTVRLTCYTPNLKATHRNCLSNETYEISSAVTNNNGRELSKNKCVSTQLYYSKLKSEGSFSNRVKTYPYRKPTTKKKKSVVSVPEKVLKENVIKLQQIRKTKSGLILDKIKEMGDLFIKSYASENAVISNVIEGSEVNGNISPSQKNPSNIKKNTHSSTANQVSTDDTKKTVIPAYNYKKHDVSNFKTGVGNVMKSEEKVNAVLNENESDLLLSENKLRPKSDFSIRDNFTYVKRNSNNNWFYKNNKNKITFKKLISKNEDDSLLSEKQHCNTNFSELLGNRYFDDQSKEKKTLHYGKLKKSCMTKEMKSNNDNEDDLNLPKKPTEFNSVIEDKNRYLKKDNVNKVRVFTSSIPRKVNEKLDPYKERKRYISDHSLTYTNSITDVESKSENENTKEDNSNKIFSYTKKHGDLIKESIDKQEQNTNNDLPLKAKYTSLRNLNIANNPSKTKSRKYCDSDKSSSSYNSHSTKTENDDKYCKSNSDSSYNKLLQQINDSCSSYETSSENAAEKTNKMVTSFSDRSVETTIVDDDLLHSDHRYKITSKGKFTDRIKLKNGQSVKHSFSKLEKLFDDYEKIKLSSDKKNFSENIKNKFNEKDRNSKSFVRSTIPTKHAGKGCVEVSYKAKGHILITELLDYKAKTMHKSEPALANIERLSLTEEHPKKNAAETGSTDVKDCGEFNSKERGDLVHDNEMREQKTKNFYKVGESVLGGETKLSTTEEQEKEIAVNNEKTIMKDSYSNKVYPLSKSSSRKDGLEAYCTENGDQMINKHQVYNTKTNNKSEESTFGSSEKNYITEVNVKENLLNSDSNENYGIDTFKKSVNQNCFDKINDPTLGKKCEFYSDKNIATDNSRSVHVSNTKSNDEFLDHFKKRNRSKNFNKISFQSDDNSKSIIPPFASLNDSCGLSDCKEETNDKSINSVIENNLKVELIKSSDSNSIPVEISQRKTGPTDLSHSHFNSPDSFIKNTPPNSLLEVVNECTAQQPSTVSLQKDNVSLPGLNQLSKTIKNYTDKSNELILLNNSTDIEKSHEELLDNFGKLIVDKRKLAMDLYGTTTSACKKSSIKSKESLLNTTNSKESTAMNNKEQKFNLLSKKESITEFQNKSLKDHYLLNSEKINAVQNSMSISAPSLNYFNSAPSTKVLKNKIKELNNKIYRTEELKGIKNYAVEKKQDKPENVFMNDFKGIKKDASFENDFYQSMKMVDNLQGSSYRDIRLRAIKNELIKMYSHRNNFLVADSKTDIDSSFSKSVVTGYAKNEVKDPIEIQLKNNSSLVNKERIKIPQNKINHLSDALILDNMNNLNNKSNYYYKKYGYNNYDEVVSNINKKIKGQQASKENNSFENLLANQKYRSDYNNVVNSRDVSNKNTGQLEELDLEKTFQSKEEHHSNKLAVYNKDNSNTKQISDKLLEEEEEAEEEEENLLDRSDIITLYYDKTSKKIKMLNSKVEHVSEEFDDEIDDDVIDCYKNITCDLKDQEFFEADCINDEEKVKLSNFKLINSCKKKSKNIETPNYKLFDFWREKITTNTELANLDDGLLSIFHDQNQTLERIPEKIPETLLKLENFVLTKNRYRNYGIEQLKSLSVSHNSKVRDLKNFVTPNPYLKTERIFTNLSQCDVNNDTDYVGTMAIHLKDSFKNSNVFSFIDSLQFSISAQKILLRFLIDKKNKFFGRDCQCPLPDSLNKITFDADSYKCNKILTVPKQLEKFNPSVKLDFGTLSVVLEAKTTDVVRSPVPFVKSLNITVEDDEDVINEIESENIKINNEAAPSEIMKIKDLLKCTSKFDHNADFFNSFVFSKNNKNSNFTEKFETFCDFPSCVALLLKSNPRSSKPSLTKDCLHFKENFMLNVVDLLESKSVELDNNNKIKSNSPRLIPVPDALYPQIPPRNYVPIEDTIDIKDKNYSCDYIFQDISNISNNKVEQFQDDYYKLRLTTPLDKLIDFPLINERKIKMRYQNDKIINIDYSSTSHIVTTVRLPSVSKILNDTMPEASKAVLERWRKKMIAELGETEFELLNKAKLQQGSDFHGCVKSYLMGTPIEELKANQPPAINRLLNSVNSVLHKISDVAVVESQVIHSELPYKGFVDCVAVYNGKPTLIEWKHSDKKKPYISSTYDAPVQLSAYLGAINYDDHYKLPVENGMVIVAYSDGSPADEFWLTIDSCDYYWKQWLERLHKFLAPKIKS